MMLERIKDILIIALAALALYLTGQLWFDEISNRNFFYTFSGVFFPSEQQAADTKINIATPYRVAVNYGDTGFDIIYNGLYNSEHTDVCNEVLIKTLESGDFVAVRELDWSAVLQMQSYIYEYKFSTPMTLFAQNFKLSANNLTSRVKNFSHIVISPYKTDGETSGVVGVYFIDEPGNQLYEYSLTLSQPDLSARMLEYIGTLRDSKREPVYAASKQSALDAGMFQDNEFIPQINDYGLYYNRITVQNPYMVNSELLLNSIGEKMKVFFDNPALVITGLTDNTVYTFRDESTIVKYFPNDVVEYSNYSVAGKRATPSFLNDYNSAVEFVMRDPEVRNDYFLADYKVEDDRHIFYFDFVINDTPMILSEDCKYETGLSHPIEITVDNGLVIKYKKLVYNYVSMNDNVGLATLDYLSLISMLLDESNYTLEQAHLSEIMLCYKIDRKGLLSMHWFVRVGGRSITRSAGA